MKLELALGRATPLGTELLNSPCPGEEERPPKHLCVNTAPVGLFDLDAHLAAERHLAEVLFSNLFEEDDSYSSASSDAEVQSVID